MHDHVARIDQHPIAMRQALDARNGHPRVLERFHDAVRHRANMNVGTAGCDDHHVSDGGFAVEIDRDDVLGLSVVETGQNSLHQ